MIALSDAERAMTTTAGTLRAARALIVRYGWSQGRNNVGGFRSDEDWGGVCVVQAIIRCNGIKCAEAYKALAEVTGMQDCGSIGIVVWNDAWGRTLDQVYGAFDKAIAKAEAQERA